MAGPAKLPKAYSSKGNRAEFASILVYSMPRWGKTNQIRSLLKHGFKPGVLSTDQGNSRGLQTIADLDIPIIPVNSWEESVLVFAELARNKAKKQVIYDGNAIDVLVVDSLSGYGQLWIKRALEVMNRDEVGVAAPGWDPRRVYAYIPEKGRQTTNALMDIPCHLLMLARETLLSEGEGQTQIRYPAPELPGEKLPRELPGWLDGVVFGKFIQGRRVLMTEAEGKIIAGVRSPEGERFPKYIKNDYGLLIKGMMGDLDAIRESEDKAPPPKTSTK